MGALSDYLEDKLLKHLFQAAAYSAPGTVYVSLHTAAPSEAAGSNEVTGNAYARVAVLADTTKWDAPVADGTAMKVANKALITFPTPTPAGWGVVSHFGIFDALTDGNLLFWGALTTSKTVNAGDTVQFAIGALSISFD